jgi:cation diffusion facilitator CzcD-associated flavoprotein CzcO
VAKTQENTQKRAPIRAAAAGEQCMDHPAGAVFPPGAADPNPAGPATSTPAAAPAARPSPHTRARLRIAIVGAGFGGIGLAVLLRRAGFDTITLFERGAAVGGTWRDNTYPGAACDVQSHLYSYSFAPRTTWSQRFSGQAEILAYIQDVAKSFGIMDAIRLNTAVIRADFDAARNIWHVETSDGASAEFDIFIPAVGQLSRPSTPAFPGLEDFQGAYFHSAAWDHSVPLAGKRIALVGSAASAVQIAPELAKSAGHLSVFQRTPNWLVPRNNRAFTTLRHKLFSHLPGYRRAVRLYLYLYGEFLFDAFRTGSWRNGLLKSVALKHLAAQIPDPELRAKLTPTFELGCKRVLFSDDFYPCLTQPNVSLITDRIERFEPAGIRTSDGTIHPIDIAVFATGFDVRNSLHHVAITGRGGIELQQRWQAGPEGYRGIGVPGYPNMFLLYGPNTNLGHNSIIVMLEAQARYIVKCLEYFVSANLNTVEVREEGNKRFNDKLQQQLGAMVWSTGCGNWYASEGRVTANWSGSTLEYRRQMKNVDWSDFVGS